MNALTNRSFLLNDFFRDIAPAFYVRPLHGDPLPSAAQIKVDVKENKDAYTVQAELAGVTKDDIDVSIDGNQVAIAAVVNKETKQEQEGRVLRSERYFGSVYRAFALPTIVDQEKAEARYENGVLTLRLPKMAGGTARKLSVG